MDRSWYQIHLSTLVLLSVALAAWMTLLFPWLHAGLSVSRGEYIGAIATCGFVLIGGECAARRRIHYVTFFAIPASILAAVKINMASRIVVDEWGHRDMFIGWPFAYYREALASPPGSYVEPNGEYYPAMLVVNVVVWTAGIIAMVVLVERALRRRGPTDASNAPRA